MSSHNEEGAVHEREIEEDVMNVPLIAWLGTVSTILITVSVLLLIGVYYLTLSQETALRHKEADARITDIEAQRAIDAMLIEGYYQTPDTEDAEGNPTRGTATMPIEIGMQDVVKEAANKPK